MGFALGALYISKKHRNTSLHFKQSIHNEPYILHLYTLFQEFCKMTLKIKDAKLKTNKPISLYFSIINLRGI